MRVSAYRTPARRSGVNVHSSFRGDVSKSVSSLGVDGGLPFFFREADEYGDGRALNRDGVDGLIVYGQRAREGSHLGKEQYELCIHVGGVPKNGMTVYTSVFKVYPSFAIRADNDLELPYQRLPPVLLTLSYHLLVHVPICTPPSKP